MSFTKAYARILWSMLPPAQMAAFSFIAGWNDMAKAYATDEVLTDLVNLELVKRSREVGGKQRELVLLTPKGRKLRDSLDSADKAEASNV